MREFIVPERDYEKAKDGLKNFFQTGTGRVVGKTVELTAVRKGGGEFPVELSVSAMKIGGVWHATGIVRDITERKKSEERLKEEVNLNTHLLAINDATANIMDMDKMMRQVLHCGSKITGCNICFSYIYDIDAAVFKPWQSYGLEQSMTAMFMTETIDEKTDFIKQAMEGRKPVIISDKRILQSVFNYLTDMETAVVIPLIGNDNYLGLIIGMYRKTYEFSEREMKVMQGIMHQVSVALEQARLHRESVDRAMELSHKIETIQVMHEIDRSILSTLESEDILEITARMTSKVISSDWVAVLLVNRERGGFVYKAGFGISFALKGGLVPFGDTSASEVVKTGRHQFVSDLSHEKRLLPLEMRLLNEGYRSHIRVPLIVKGEIIAMLIIGSKRVAAFTPEDLSTLEKIAAQISVALENARLVSDLKDLFIGTVKSLASAIDAKSPWTAGHSERVTRYALDIGSKIGFSISEIKDIELGGLLHDIGKIGTYETILDKPGKLTEEEFKLIKQHPAKGAEILSPIKQIRHVIPIVRHHHERYDGRGYPDGLKGEEIPLMARIMCVADSVDAMGADRPYRKGLSMDVIIGELKKCSGSQFDPKVVDVFLKL
ncbi:MAG: GAF domain-containing protein, partial [Nitrospinae bacterium]|nr:GAF domain-containing protein [Nitrospinota bacterium]